VVGTGDVAADLGERTHQGDAAAGHDALFDRRTGGVQGVFDAGLLLLHLDFSRGTHLDDGNTAGELGLACLPLLEVVAGVDKLDIHKKEISSRIAAVTG
jgi:hypothetical protein